MGDRICVMKDGHIMQVATPLDLYNAPANLFVAGFIGSPPMNFFRGLLRPAGSKLAFAERSDHVNPVAFDLPPPLARAAVAHGGKDVVFGIRPEDIHVVPPETHAPDAFDATVEVAEPMGAETFLYLTTGATPFIARVAPTQSADPGQRLRLRFDLTKAHLFDAPSEQRLC